MKILKSLKMPKKQIRLFICPFVVVSAICGCSIHSKTPAKGNEQITITKQDEITNNSSTDVNENSTNNSNSNYNTNQNNEDNNHTANHSNNDSNHNINHSNNDSNHNTDSINDNNVNSSLSNEAPFAPYAINDLTGRQKRFYHELEAKVASLEPFYYSAEEYDDEAMQDMIYACDALMKDMPQIKNYFYLDCIFGDTSEILGLESRYYCIWETEEVKDIETIKEGIKTFEDICDSIVADMPETATAYEKYHYLAAAVSDRLEYDFAFETPGLMSPYCIVTGYAVCTGYTEIYQYLCMKANLFCRQVFGSSLDETEYHVWNLIQIDGDTYYVDITWSDALGNPGEPEWEKYFATTQKEILKDHLILDNTVATGERKTTK